MIQILRLHSMCLNGDCVLHYKYKKTTPTPTRDCCRESCSLFTVLRHRTPSSSIGLSEVTQKPVALSRVFLLFSGRESVILVKKKAPSRSDILLSTHVVLKTKHVNPNIHVRRYQSHVRSPNLSTIRPQLLSLRGATTYIQVTSQSYIASHRKLYRNQSKAIQHSSPSYITLSTHIPIWNYCARSHKEQHSPTL